MKLNSRNNAVRTWTAHCGLRRHSPPNYLRKESCRTSVGSESSTTSTTWSNLLGRITWDWAPTSMELICPRGLKIVPSFQKSRKRFCGKDIRKTIYAKFWGKIFYE